VLLGGSPQEARAQAPECEDQEAGTVCVVKVTDPEETDAEFDFNADGGDFTLGAGETNEVTLPDVGESITITEEEQEGWSVESIACDGEGVTVDEEDVDSGSATLTVDDEDATATCVFTNAQDGARITITKETRGGAEDDFDFETDFDESFSLSDGESETFVVEDGTYEVTEETDSAFELTEVDCGDADVDEIENGVSIEVEEGDEVECVFTNDPIVADDDDAEATPTTRPTQVQPTSQVQQQVATPTPTRAPVTVVPPSTGSAGMK
jgi:hypothetical protein